MRSKVLPAAVTQVVQKTHVIQPLQPVNEEDKCGGQLIGETRVEGKQLKLVDGEDWCSRSCNNVLCQPRDGEWHRCRWLQRRAKRCRTNSISSAGSSINKCVDCKQSPFCSETIDLFVVRTHNDCDCLAV